MVMEDARIRAFLPSLGSNIRTLSLPLLIAAAFYAWPQSAKAAECQTGSVPGGDVLTGNNDTCVITSASPLTDDIDALGQGAAATDADTIKLDATTGAGGSFSFDLSHISSAATGGQDFLNFEAVQIESSATTSVTVSGTNSDSVNWVNHGFVRGNANFVGNFTNDGGTVSPGLANGDVGTMTFTGDLVGGTNLGTLRLDVDLSVGSNPGIDSDFIHVTGKTAGSMFLDVHNIGLTGVATTGDGILVMQVDGAGSTGSFGLTDTVVAGAYQYIPKWVADYSGTQDGLFLQSVLREEFYGHTALLASEQAMIRACFRSDQRIPDAPRSRDNVRMWAGGGVATFKTESDVGVQLEDQMTCATGGLDFGLGEGIRFGVVGGYGSSSVDVTAPAALLKLDGSTAAVEALLAIGTPMYFFNVSGGYATTDWTYDGAVAQGLDATQSGLIASAQAGATLNMTPFRFKFIGAVNYDQTKCGNDCLLAGMTEDTGIVEAKGTIRIEAMTTQINPYIAVSFSDDLSGGNTVSYLGESVNLDAGHNLLSLNGGFYAPLDDGLLLYGDFSIIDGMSNSTSGYSFAGGLKAFW
jgi:hypothetical protein